MSLLTLLATLTFSAGLDPDTDHQALERLNREIALASKRRERLEQELRIREIESQLGTPSDDLRLVGIMTDADGHRLAEFQIGEVVFRAAPGDTLTSGWQLQSVARTAVVLYDPNTKQERAMAFTSRALGTPQ